MEVAGKPQCADADQGALILRKGRARRERSRARHEATNIVSVVPDISEIAFILPAGLRPMSRQTGIQRSEQEGYPEKPSQRKAKRGYTFHMRRSTTIGIIAVGVLVVVGLVSLVRSYRQILGTSGYSVIDTVPCQSAVQNEVHFHAHVSVYINGKRTPIPANVGLAPDGSCLYWVHTDDESGVIHIEAPAGVALTLGNFLDIWAQQFRRLDYPSQLSDPGRWQVYVDGQPFTSDFHTILLHSHTLITLAYNSPGVKPDTYYNWDDL